VLLDDDTWLDLSLLGVRGFVGVTGGLGALGRLGGRSIRVELHKEEDGVLVKDTKPISSSLTFCRIKKLN
jgi:hypothetical protein